MSRFTPEDLQAKLEWEGWDGVEWFQPEEVPAEISDLWRTARFHKDLFEGAMRQIDYWLEENVSDGEE